FANLEPPVHGDETALREVVGDNFSELTECDAVDEVGLLLAVLRRERAIHSNAEVCHRRAALAIAKLRIGDETTDKHHAIQHECTTSATRCHGPLPTRKRATRQTYVSYRVNARSGAMSRSLAAERRTLLTNL